MTTIPAPLLLALTAAVCPVARATTLPVLGHARITLSPGTVSLSATPSQPAGTITLSATDLDKHVSVSAPLAATQPLDVLVDAGRLASFAQVATGPVRLTLGTGRLTLSAGPRVTLPTLSPADWPLAPPAPPLTLAVSGSDFSAALRRSSRFMGKDASAGFLSGVRVIAGPDHLTLVSSDRRAMAVTTVPLARPSDATAPPITVPDHTVLYLISALTDAGEVGLGLSDRLLTVAATIPGPTSDVTLSLRVTTNLLAGDWANWQGLVAGLPPVTGPDVTVATAPLSAAVAAALRFAPALTVARNEHVMWLSPATPGSLSADGQHDLAHGLDVESWDGNFRATVETSGPWPYPQALNGRHLVAILAAARGASVALRPRGQYAALQVIDEAAPADTYLSGAMRLPYHGGQ